ncbi:hypothetical protein [Marimonas arenosa]
MHFNGRLNNCLGKVYACRHEIVDRFYELLFEERPDVKDMFTGDFHKQKEMFSMMIAMLARATATGQGAAEMGNQIREQHEGLDIEPELFIRSGVLLRQAFVDVLGDQIGDFEKVLLTESIGRLTAAAAGRQPCLSAGSDAKNADGGTEG